MLQLHGDLRAVLVNAFSEAAETGDEVIAGHPHLKGLRCASRERHRAHAHDQ